MTEPSGVHGRRKVPMDEYVDAAPWHAWETQFKESEPMKHGSIVASFVKDNSAMVKLMSASKPSVPINIDLEEIDSLGAIPFYRSAASEWRQAVGLAAIEKRDSSPSPSGRGMRGHSASEKSLVQLAAKRHEDRLAEDVLAEALRLRSPDVEPSRIAMDVDYVVRLLRTFLHDRQARTWIFSHNEQLGTRPLDALALSKTGALIDAVDAQKASIY